MNPSFLASRWRTALVGTFVGTFVGTVTSTFIGTCALLYVPATHAATDPAAEALFNWAERTYPSLFPAGASTQTAASYSYRGYWLSGYFLAVANGRVYLKGEATQHQMQDMGALSSYTCQVNPSASGCPNANLPNPRYSAVTGGCVTDSATGLTWEVKTNDGGLRDGRNSYTNLDSIIQAQKWNGSAYVAPTLAELEAAGNSLGYVKAINTQGLCGYKDWRLPTEAELKTLLLPQTPVTIDSTWFPYTQAAAYWTSSLAGDGSNPAYASFIYFTDQPVTTIFYGRDSSLYLRLVRSTTAPVTLYKTGVQCEPTTYTAAGQTHSASLFQTCTGVVSPAVCGVSDQRIYTATVAAADVAGNLSAGWSTTRMSCPSIAAQGVDASTLVGTWFQNTCTPFEGGGVRNMLQVTSIANDSVRLSQGIWRYTDAACSQGGQAHLGPEAIGAITFSRQASTAHVVARWGSISMKSAQSPLVWALLDNRDLCWLGDELTTLFPSAEDVEKNLPDHTQQYKTCYQQR